METSLDYQIVNSYKRLPYEPWFAMAEFIDNSTQAYFNNERLLKSQLKSEGKNLFVKINYTDKKIIIKDNSIGMNKDELNYALRIGQPPVIHKGRSKYGLGLKTAACWFGDRWTIRTKKFKDKYEHTIVFDVQKIAKANLDLSHKQRRVSDINKHYTIIEIEPFHSSLTSSQVKKIKDYLSSIYRLDFKNYNLQLFFQEDLLDWKRFEPKLYIDEKDNKEKKTEFKFKINKKKITGWIGILAKGSRKNAGFSMIQSNRVVVGWPNSYRPMGLFGNQPGGSNDLANQRIVGEIYMEGFEVSHTKNAILWENNEEDIFNNKLLKVVGDYRDYANGLRTSKETDIRPKIISDSVEQMKNELLSKEFKDLFVDLTEINEELLTESNKLILAKVIKENNPEINIRIGKQKLKLYINRDLSLNDPYLISETKNSNDELIIVINRNHPHWKDLSSYEGVFNYIRHCAYDGISEWKAKLMTQKLKPDTIKWIKDRFLRLSFEINKS